MNKRDRHALVRVGGQIEALEELAAAGRGDPCRRARADAVVVEHRADPQQPLGALIDQRLAEMQPRAPLTNMLGRDPRLRQPPLREQLAEPQRVLAVGLRATLATPQRPRLHGLGQMRSPTARLDALCDEQPARARLDRDMHLTTAKRPIQSVTARRL